jgi:hypothetical protein
MMIEMMQSYRWVTQGMNCARCEALSGAVHSLEAWQASRMPGFHAHCDCRLEPAGVQVTAQPAQEWLAVKRTMSRVVTDIRGFVTGSNKGLRPTPVFPKAEPNIFLEARRGYTGY